jgi:hypothetical protein
MVPVGIENVIGLETINRNEHDRHATLLCGAAAQ